MDHARERTTAHEKAQRLLISGEYQLLRGPVVKQREWIPVDFVISQKKRLQEQKRLAVIL